MSGGVRRRVVDHGRAAGGGFVVEFDCGHRERRQLLRLGYNRDRRLYANCYACSPAAKRDAEGAP